MTTGPPPPITDSLGVTQASDSWPEYRFAAALHKYGWPFDFQWNFYDARLITKVDFKVETVPLWTPVFIDGEYFHGTASAKKNDEFIRALFRSRLGGKARPPVPVVGSELKTFEAAEDVVLKLFGRN